MPKIRGYYSIVQYCPDLARREVVNIGVVLFVGEKSYLRVRLCEHNRRVKQFFGTDTDELNYLTDFKESFKKRIEFEQDRIDSLERFEHFASSRGNQLQLTHPALFKVGDCQSTLDELYERLVELPPDARQKGN